MEVEIWKEWMCNGCCFGILNLTMLKSRRELVEKNYFWCRVHIFEIKYEERLIFLIADVSKKYIFWYDVLRTASMKMQHNCAAEADRSRSRVSAALLDEQWANRPCGFVYRDIFFEMHAKLELAHHLQTSKMRLNLTSLNTCQHDGNIVTVCIVWRRCTLFCERLQEEAAIFAVCERRANESFACMCKEKKYFENVHSKSTYELST